MHSPSLFSAFTLYLERNKIYMKLRLFIDNRSSYVNTGGTFFHPTTNCRALKQMSGQIFSLFAEKKMFVSPRQVLTLGLDYISIDYERWSEKTKIETFHAFYGSSPLVIAELWYDMMNDGGEYLRGKIRLWPIERKERGFKRYMMAHYWLWIYPCNVRVYAVLFSKGIKYI